MRMKINRSISVYAFLSVVVFLIGMMTVNVSMADEIVLVNGDRLTGTVSGMENGVVIFETEYAGEVNVQASQIRRIETSSPVEIHLLNGEVLKGNLTTGEGGSLMIEGSDVRGPFSLGWDKVAALNPPPVEPLRWKGSINLGASHQEGNTDRTAASIGANAERRTEQDRFSIRFLHNYAEEDNELTARNTYGALKFDYFITEKFYSYLAVELLNDEFKDLNLRTVVGPGVGYQIWEEDRRSLLFEAGISYFSEDLETGMDDDWITARLAASLLYKVTEFLTFSDDLIVYPSLEDGGEFQLRNEASFTAPLASAWSMKFANIFEHDSDPAPGVKENDTQWLLGLQYDFL